ncbi:MAG: LemA family protein [Clostridiales bacterium]|nr:LemA family protein [Clostridiales bacterium]
MLLVALSNKAIGLIVGGVIALVVIILIVWIISTRNSFVRLRNGADEAWATIDVYLKKRYDLIPNLVETVKGYTKHESETLENVIKARNMAMSAGTPDDKIDAENQLTGCLKTLFSLTEAYPDLKANSQFLSLQGQLESIEGDLAQSRKFYNAKVKAFNTKRELFPASIVAGIMHLKPRKYFELDSEEERKNIKVSF